MTMTEANALFSKLPYAEARHRLAEECRANGVNVDEANASVFELITGASSENGMKKERDSNKGNPFDDEHGGRNGDGDGAPSSSESHGKSGNPFESNGESDGKGNGPSESNGEGSGENGDPIPSKPDNSESTPSESKPEGEGENDGDGNNGKRKRNTPSWKTIAEQQKKEMEQQKKEMEEKLREAEKKSNGPQSLDEIDEEIRRLAAKAEAIREEERKRKEEEERKRKESMKNREHRQSHEVLRRLKCRGTVMLKGPAGTGKSHLAINACQKLFDIKGDAYDVVRSGKFAQISFSPDTMSADMLGYQDANGVYHETDIVRVFRDGGVILFDEIDSADGTVLTKLNTMLANGTVPTPDGVVTRNPKTYIIWTGNTWGTGGDSMYMRNRLDAATLDRVVASTITIDYDAELEKGVCEGFGISADQNRLLNNVVSIIRKLINDNNWRYLCSTRFVIGACQMLSYKEEPYTMKEVVDAYLEPWDANSKRIVMERVGRLIEGK